MMTINDQSLRDVLKTQILTLTDKQAEHVLHRLSLLLEKAPAGTRTTRRN